MTVYVSVDGLVSPPLFVGVSVMVPAVVGVMVNVCDAGLPEKVRVVGESPVAPVPVGVMVMVPVYRLYSVTVNTLEAVLTFPDEDPVKVKVVAGTVILVTLLL